MSSKVTRIIIAGIAFYALFVFLVIQFYPDKPENMDWQDREEYNKVQITKLRLKPLRTRARTRGGSAPSDDGPRACSLAALRARSSSAFRSPLARLVPA